MNQLFGQSADPVRSIESDLVPSAVPVRPLPVSGPEQAFFHLDVRRSLQLHWRLAAGVAITFAVLAVSYFLLHAFVLKTWPSYLAESVIYVQPAPARVLESSQGEAARWPYDTNTYESYMQQQMMNVSREDVLISALHKLQGWQKAGESDQAAAQRLVRSLSVDRSGTAYQFTIGARARTAQMAADVANALTAAYMESATRDQKTGDRERLAILKQERDRIQNLLDADRTEQQALNRQLGVASVSSAIPDHYDADIAQMRSELVKARTDHDAAEAKFASMDAGQGTSSAAIDAEADEMIAADAGLVSMKQALNLRRATLISQMANLTPSHPQYKQDEAELAKINGDLDAMMKDLRAEAAAQIQLKLQAELQRTGGVETQLNNQVRQLVGAAGSATPKMQRSSDLAADVTRLQARYAAIDEELHNVMLENSAPASVYPVTTAVPPLTRTKSGVVRNAFLIVFAGLFFGLVAAVAKHKLDPKVYIASDVELVLGFAPMAQLPDFNEVPEAVADEYLLRLASSIEHARKQSNLRSCVFTGINEGNGVTTLMNRIRAMLEAMGRPTVLVDASGAPPLSDRVRKNVKTAVPGLVALERVSRPTALLQQMEEETETEDEALVLTDTAPLAVSAETEYLARFVDCAIVVIESGRTTRRELREAAATLQRLDVGAVGFVLNRVGLAKAEPGFRKAITAIEKHLQAQNLSRRAEAVKSAVPAKEPESEAPSFDAEARAHFEPELAAVAAAVARFSTPSVVDATTCLPTPTMPAPAAKPVNVFHTEFDATQETAAPVSVTVAPFEEAAQRSSSRMGASVPALDADFEPFAYVSQHFASHASMEEPVGETAEDRAEVASESAEVAPDVDEAEIAAKAVEADAAAPSVEPTTAPADSEAEYAAQVTETDLVSSPVEAEPVSAVHETEFASPIDEAHFASPSVDAEPVLGAGEAERTEHAAEIEVEASTPIKAAKPVLESAPEITADLEEAPVAGGPSVHEEAETLPTAAMDLPVKPVVPEPAPEADVPWWLSQTSTRHERMRPPVLWKPARVWMSEPSGTAGEALPTGPAPHPGDARSSLFERGSIDSDSFPAGSPAGEAEAHGNAPGSLTSRLSGLRNLLFVMGVKNPNGPEEGPGRTHAAGASFGPRSENSAAEVLYPDPKREATPTQIGDASPRLVTAPPEFLPPKPIVIKVDKDERPAAEPHVRQDRRTPFDGIEILPSKRGQFKKV